VLAANYYFTSEFDLQVKSPLHLGWIFGGEGGTIARGFIAGNYGTHKNMTGTIGEVWNEAPVTQTLAV